MGCPSRGRAERDNAASIRSKSALTLRRALVVLPLLDDLGEALTPGRIPRRPAKLAPGFGVGAGAALCHHRHKMLARDETCEPRRDSERWLCAKHVRQCR